MRFALCLLLVCASAFGYKDAFYVGAYGGAFEGTLEKKTKADLENDGYLQGFRLGWNNNMRSNVLAKIRWELYYERRDFTYDLSGADKKEDGWHAGASVALGYNTDLFLTQELTPYVTIGTGLGGFGKDFGDGSNLNLGVGLAFTFRYFELTLEARREFWQLKGYRFAFQTPFKNDGTIDMVSAGLNFRF
ncbi:MAG: porin family protein [Helicobacteraceae bacterium]|jgi:hypothetical protein|nr:porin family protein [Helicobacteraceae bacterium]